MGELLDAIYAQESPDWLRRVPALETTRRIWLQNYLQTEDGLRFRLAEEGLPPSTRFVRFPYDDDVHLGKKRIVCWVGYNVCLTETCEEDCPNLITHVETTSAPTADGVVTPRVHHDLQEQNLPPAIHVLDTGSLDAELLVTSKQNHGIELLGPTRRGRRSQSRAAEGLGMADYVVDFERQTAICPEGHESQEWVPRIDARGNDSIYTNRLDTWRFA